MANENVSNYAEIIDGKLLALKSRMVLVSPFLTYRVSGSNAVNAHRVFVEKTYKGLHTKN